MQKPLIFISHITEEREIALALKRLIESSFLGMMDVFVSSDPTSIELGRRWLEQITVALKHCAVEVILASPESVRRPWINFEAGAGWIRDIPVIPLCHSGMVPGKLPSPMSNLQAALATDVASLRLIFPVLAKAIGCANPAVEFDTFVDIVRQFEAITEQSRVVAGKLPTAPPGGLPQHEFDALRSVAEAYVSPRDAAPFHQYREEMNHLGYPNLVAILAVKMLERRGFIESTVIENSDGYGTNEYPGVVITEEGWVWLATNHELLPNIQARPRPTSSSTEPPPAADNDVPF